MQQVEPAVERWDIEIAVAVGGDYPIFGGEEAGGEEKFDWAAGEGEDQAGLETAGIQQEKSG